MSKYKESAMGRKTAKRIAFDAVLDKLEPVNNMAWICYDSEGIQRSERDMARLTEALIQIREPLVKKRSEL